VRRTRSHIAALVAVLLAAGALGAQAAVVSEDVAYWYRLSDQSPVLTVFNPDADWLQSNLGYLLIKVQQTVYDPEQSAQILQRDGQSPAAAGFLYAYSVTNLNWDDGVTGFRVDWQVESLFTTVSNRVTPSGWSVNAASTVPEWLYTPTTDYGIAPGETVGGLWALALTGQDQIVSAGAASLAEDGSDLPYWIAGQTTAPVPDPAPMTTVLMGLGGLGLTRLRRRR